jgi:hypothetical protein
MKKLLPLIIIIGLFLAACGGIGGSSEISVKVDGQEKTFEPTSHWAYHSTKTFSYPENGKTVMTKAAYSSIVLANYELDTKQAFISLNKQKIDKPEQIKVMFSITGDKDSSVDTPVKTGEYTAESERFNKVDSVTAYYFADGQEKRVTFNDGKMKGAVTITGISDGTISGDIDVTDGENSVKGSFAAKGHESVK